MTERLLPTTQREWIGSLKRLGARKVSTEPVEQFHLEERGRQVGGVRVWESESSGQDELGWSHLLMPSPVGAA